MKINLRKANAMQESLYHKYNDMALLNHSVSISLNEFTDPQTEIENARKTWKETLDRVSKILDVIFSIRKKLGRANVESGVSDTLTDLARLNNEIDFFRNFERAKTVDDIKVIKGKLEKIRTSEKSLLSDTVMTSFLYKEDLDYVNEKLRNSLKNRQNLQDKLLEINISTYVELDQNEVDLLQEEGII